MDPQIQLRGQERQGPTADSRRNSKIGVTSRRPMAELASISWRPIRSSKQISSVSWCSVSGSSLINSTFASRQQTNSSTPSKPLISKKISTSLVRDQIAQSYQRSSRSFNVRCLLLQRPVPLLDLPCTAGRDLQLHLTRRAVFTPMKKALAVSRKHYVANLQRKMDFAVGEVVNELSVGTILEGSTETYKYQSEKHQIGNQLPKWCLRRIMWSPTMTVRAGGV
ncbi:uncharacterized protein SCHCODRAFT_02635694 [Schizophyllum commune H4-8]|uniref:uncharacterized protein n=1 Tax=Schizophyllum commune (strain H4-8 / FGSC 9210) TaxID=578458 RepID=UPI00215EA92F|nr:uncharacterized protein SCHCODRAFT_02635694 [Schizophyllum commune H4-8]KAI5889813.1 hypothetical protein SCHCODRAFT_02635694 [Schizophyllum commune H4-8]